MKKYNTRNYKIGKIIQFMSEALPSKQELLDSKNGKKDTNYLQNGQTL